MKNLLIIFLVFSVSFVKAQSCPFVSCRDSLAYTVTTGSLAINAGYSGISYSILNGPGSISGSTISGLKPGSTTVIQLVATGGGITTVAVKVITVAASPVKQRSVINFSAVYVNGVLTGKFQYDDGSTQ